LLVGIGVGVALNSTALAAEEAMKSRTSLVAAASLNGVALSAAGLEEVGTLLSVACVIAPSAIYSAPEQISS